MSQYLNNRMIELTGVEEELLNELNFREWQNAGLNGEGQTFFEVEWESNHCSQVIQAAQIFAPKAKYYNREGVRHKDLLKYVDEIQPTVVGMSQSSNLEYYKWFADGLYERGIPFFKSADNFGKPIEEKYLASYNKLIAIIAITKQNKKANYSSYGEFADFSMYPFLTSGTSLATPSLIGMQMLVNQHYGKNFNHDEAYKFWKMCSLDLENKGFDLETAWGRPTFPNVDKKLSDIMNLDNIMAKKVELRISSTNAYVNGELYKLRNAPYIVDNEGIDNDEAFAGIRFLAEVLDYTVNYNNGVITLTNTESARVVKLTIGSKIAYINNKAFELRNAPYIVDRDGIQNDEAFLGIRFLGEALGYNVSYNNGLITMIK